MAKGVAYVLLAVAYAKVIPASACMVLAISAYLGLAGHELLHCRQIRRLRRLWRRRHQQKHGLHG